MPAPEEDDSFYFFGDLRPFEARELLPRLEEMNIRFQLGSALTDGAGIGGYGSRGTSSRIKLFVRRDDEAEFRKISDGFFKM